MRVTAFAWVKVPVCMCLPPPPPPLLLRPLTNCFFRALRCSPPLFSFFSVLVPRNPAPQPPRQVIADDIMWDACRASKVICEGASEEDPEVRDTDEGWRG